MARILLIDDDDPVREVLQRTLERLDHEVETAVDGEQGLEAFARCVPDLVITDLLMPRMDGVELIRRIREQDPDARVIAISGGGNGLEVDGGLGLASGHGPLTVMQKPFTRQRLRQAIEETLEGAAE